MGSYSELQTEWRLPSWIRATCWAASGAAAALAAPCAVFVISGAWNPSSGLYGLMLCLGFGVGAYIFGLRPKITLTPNALLVRNPFKTTRIDWHEIASVKPLANGVHIILTNGEVTAKAVAKSNIAVALERRNRADYFAEQIEQVARGRGAAVPVVDPVTHKEESRRRAILTRKGLVVTYVVALIIWLIYLAVPH